MESKYIEYKKTSSRMFIHYSFYFIINEMTLNRNLYNSRFELIIAYLYALNDQLVIFVLNKQ
jgi:hypothetical protein